MRNDLVFDIWCCTCTQTELHNVHMEYRQQLIRDANSWQEVDRTAGEEEEEEVDEEEEEERHV